ncbi:MAG TPA: metalloregulator ArsR/SmtB family transcription factor [Candidatus Angelobacter sp.]|nr:metalloregulator ArsR/SmtB family transcription factor [Candidatus Angelobacter sp.]
MPSSTRAKRRSADDRLDLVFHALSDRTRRALLGRLAQGPAMVSELAEPFDMSRIAVSKHVRVLERARLVARAVDGRVHRCSLVAKPLQDVEQWLDHYRAFWGDTLDLLAHYVERDETDERH